MSRPFEGKCMNCVVDKQGCSFEPQKPGQCTWCARHRYRCSERELDPRRRKLSPFKCDHCREKHHKCLPETRQWPQRCNFCNERDLPCSPPRSKRARSCVRSSSVRSQRLSVSPGRAPLLPDGSDHNLEIANHTEELPLGREHQGHHRNNSLDHDLLHPPFIGLMDLLHDLTDPSGHQLAGPLQQHPITPVTSSSSPHSSRPISGEFRIHVTPANIENLDTDGQELLMSSSSNDTRRFLQSLDLLELSVATKRRLVHFLYAADQPLTLTQFSIIPAINTNTRVFEADKILPLGEQTAQDYLTCWFGKLITFDSTQKTVQICDDGGHRSASKPFGQFAEPEVFFPLFVSHEEAHAEALYICTTYLLLARGGSGSTHVGGMGFQYSDENDLSGVLEQLRTGRRRTVDIGFDESTPDTSDPEQSPNQLCESDLSPFYSLLEYATLNWPRHLASITPLPNTAQRVSNGVSLSVLRTVSLILSFQFLTWLECLDNILCGNNQHNSEAVALAQAYVFGTFKRWVKASSLQAENPTNIKLFIRALHWLNILQSVNILGQVQEVSQSARGSFSSFQKRKSTIFHELHAKFATLGSFEQVPQNECDLIVHTKFDPGYWKFMIRLINGCREPCIVDLKHRIAFYVVQQSWSGGALQLECVDLATGLILGRDSHWTKRFFGWRHRVIITKSETHLGLQVVAEQRNSEQQQNLLITYVWAIRDMGSLRLGQGILKEGWKIHENLTTFNLGEASMIDSNLYRQGQLQFGSDGITVQTPHGTWDLRTKMRLGVHSPKPTLLAVSGNGYFEAHAEWDARTNSCSNLFLRDCASQATCQLLPHIFSPMEYHTMPTSSASAILSIRYVAFNHSGTKFIAQAELASGSNANGKEITWFVWQNQGGFMWVLKEQRPTHEEEFWPLLGHEPMLEDIETICSVHQVVESAFIP